jgi:DNA-binding response OmpR family regulator
MNKTILIVEDNDDIRRLLELRLNFEGYNTVTADNGLDGLEKAKKGDVDLVILDLVLPKMPGEEVCRQIRRDGLAGEIPVVMLTAKTHDADKIIGKVIGANCYLCKPYEASVLVDEIKKLLGEK